MKFAIDINRKHLLYTVFLVAVVGGVGLVVGYGGNNPTIMGHTWSEITCFDCLTSGNISTGAVTSDEILDKTIKDDDISLSANINGSKIADGTIPASALEGGGVGGGTIKTYKISVSSSASQSKTYTWTCPAGNVTLIEAPLGTIKLYYKSAQTSNLCSYAVSDDEITIKAFVYQQVSGMYIFNYARETCSGGGCYAHTCSPTIQCVELIEESY